MSGSDVEDLYRSIPSLETMEIRTASHLHEIFLPLLPTRRVLHSSLRFLRLSVTREAQDKAFAMLTTITHGRKAMGCVTWSIECVCDESCEEISDQWAIHCERNGFDDPGIVEFTKDPGFLDRQRKISEGQPTGVVSVPEAGILKASCAPSNFTLSDTAV